MASSWRGLVKHIYKQSQAIGVASGPHTVLWSHTAPRLLWQRQHHDAQRRWKHSHTQHSNTMRSPLLIRSASTQTGSANARLIQLCRDGDMKQVKALCPPTQSKHSHDKLAETRHGKSSAAWLTARNSTLQAAPTCCSCWTMQARRHSL